MAPNENQADSAKAHERIDKLVDDFGEHRKEVAERFGDVQAGIVEIQAHEAGAAQRLEDLAGTLSEETAVTRRLARDTNHDLHDRLPPLESDLEARQGRRAFWRKVLAGIAIAVATSAILGAGAWAWARIANG